LRAPYDIIIDDDIPKFLWKTNIPKFTLDQFEIIKVEKLSDALIIHLKDSPIYHNCVKLRIKDKHKNLYEMKRCYFFNKLDAAKRLQKRFHELSLSQESELLNRLNEFKNNYPELVL